MANNDSRHTTKHPAPLHSEIQEFLDHCLDTDKSIATVSSYRQVLLTFAGWLDTTHPQVSSITEVSLSHLQQFRRHLRLESAANGHEMTLGTQSKYLSVLRSWLRYAQREARLPVLDREEVSLPKRRNATTRPSVDQDDIEQLLDQVDTRKAWGLRDRAIVAVLMATGLKVSQLCALDRRDIREDILGTVPALPLRGGARQRAAAILDQRAQLCLKEYLATRQDTYRPLFIRHKPGKRLEQDDPEHRLTRQMINRMLEKYSRMAHIPQLVSPSMIGRTDH